MPKFKPRLLEDIIKHDNIIGQIVGVNIKPINFNNELLLDNYIGNILRIKTTNHSLLYIEDMENIDLNMTRLIEEKTSMKIPRGDNIKVFNLPLVIQEIIKILNEDINKQEVLIISDDKEKTIEVIKSLYKTIRFISIIGLSQEENDDVYELILESTGISLFQPINIEQQLKKYNIIINFKNSMEFDSKNIRRGVKVFDFSIKKPFKVIEKRSINDIIICDMSFDLKQEGIKESPWLDLIVNSGLYDGLMRDKWARFYGIYSRNAYYDVKEFINKEVRVKGSI